MQAHIGGTLLCVLAALFAILVVVIRTWKWAAPGEFRLGKEPSDDLRAAERDICEVSRQLVGIITIPVLGFIERRLALEEQRVASSARELKGMRHFANLFLADYLDGIQRTAPLQRLEALEQELSILRVHLLGLLMEDRLFCSVRMLLSIEQCGKLLGGAHWSTEAEAAERAHKLLLTFQELEDDTYDLDAHLKALESEYRFRSSDGDAVENGD